MDWRDRTLDWIADDLERNGLQAKADRLRHFLQGARAIASENSRFDTPAQTARLEAWVAERLPELAHERPVTTIGPYWRRRLTLTGEFRRVREHDRLTGRQHSAMDWDPVIVQAEAGLTAVKDDQGRMVSLASRPLSPEERMEVIADRRGVIREPQAMAEMLLYLACRPHDEELKNFRTQLNRYEPRPVPLVAPDPNISESIPFEPAPPPSA